MKNKFVRNTLIYFLLIVGYMYLYSIDVEALMNPAISIIKSKATFIYQQF